MMDTCIAHIVNAAEGTQKVMFCIEFHFVRTHSFFYYHFEHLKSVSKCNNSFYINVYIYCHYDRTSSKPADETDTIEMIVMRDNRERRMKEDVIKEEC